MGRKVLVDAGKGDPTILFLNNAINNINGATLPDTSGNGYNATITGVTASGIVNFGKMLWHDGIDDFCEGTYPNASSYTMVVWYKGTDSVIDNDAALCVLSRISGGSRLKIYAYDGFARVRLYDNLGSGSNYITSTTKINDNVLHCLLAEYDADTETTRLYVDNNEEGTALTKQITTLYYNQLWLGRGAGGIYTEGYIGGVRLYTRILTKDERVFIYKNPNFEEGFADFSDVVRDNLTYTKRFATDDYHHAINVANLTFNYHGMLYNLIQNTEEDIKIEILDDEYGIKNQGVVVASGLQFYGAPNTLVSGFLLDNSGNNRTASIINGASIDDADLGLSVDLTATSGYVNLVPQTLPEFTVSFIYKGTDPGYDDSGTSRASMFISRSSSTAIVFACNLLSNGVPRFRWTTSGGTSIVLTSTIAVNDGEPHSIIIRHSGINASIIVDGQEKRNDDTSLTTNVSTAMAIARYYTSTTNFVEGVYSQIKIWNRYLSDEECALITSYKEIFNGYFPPTLSRRYDGIIENMQLNYEATDSTEKLDVPIGDIVYLNYTLWNPVTTASSIIHQLAYLAGFTNSEIDQTISIPVTYTGFAPNSEEDSILDVIDVLLFENGYVLNFNNSGQLSALPWIQDVSTLDPPIFNEYNIIGPLQVREQIVEYDGAEVTYYNATTLSGVRVYTENLPYGENGVFAGYVVLSGTYYPVEANVIDDTTGENQVVYQEFTDVGIKYATNRAIVNQLDYNYKAFGSNYTDMIATTNHVLRYSTNVDNVNNLTLITGEYYNRKARVLLYASGMNMDLFYLTIDADVLYKTAVLKSKVLNKTNAKKIYRYDSQFTFDGTTADDLTKAMASIYKYGYREYMFESEDDVETGDIVSITAFDGTDQAAIVLEKTFDEQRPTIFSYVMKGYASAFDNITDRSVRRKSAPPLTSSNIIIGSSTYTGNCNLRCDGVDDQEEIQFAIEYATALWGEANIKLTRGEFVISSGILGKSNTIIEGAGSELTVIIRGTGTWHGINFNGVSERIKNVQVKGLSLYNGDANTEIDPMIRFNYVDNFICEDILISGAYGSGIQTYYATDGSIKNVVIKNCPRANTYASVLLGYSDNIIVDDVIINTVVSGYGAAIVEGTGCILDTLSMKNVSYGIITSATIDVGIQNCIINGYANYGILLGLVTGSPGLIGANVSSNRIIGGGKSISRGIYLDGGIRNSITNNVISVSSGMGITFTESSYNILANNTISGCNLHGIQVMVVSDYNSIGNNVIYDCATPSGNAGIILVGSSGGANNNIISNNICKNNYRGLHIQTVCSGNNVTGNILINNDTIDFYDQGVVTNDVGNIYGIKI